MTQAAAGSDGKKGSASLRNCWLATGMGVVLLGAAAWGYGEMVRFDFLRVKVLWGWVAAGVGAMVCFGGAMHFVDGALQERARRRPARWGLMVMKRVLLVVQLGAGAMALAAGLMLMFDWDAPGATRPARPGVAQTAPTRPGARRGSPTIPATTRAGPRRGGPTAPATVLQQPRTRPATTAPVTAPASGAGPAGSQPAPSGATTR